EEVTMSDIVIHDFPGKQVRVEQINVKEKQSQEDLARSAVEALFLFAGRICEPVSMDLQVAYCDLETGCTMGDPTPHQPFWLFRRRDLSPRLEIRPAWNNEEVVTVDILRSASILESLKQPLGQNCNREGCEAGWQEMLFRANCVRLPASMQTLAEETLVVRYGRGTIEHPVERRGDGLWVCGPLARKTPTAPIELKLSNDAGLLTFDIWLLWSLW